MNTNRIASGPAPLRKSGTLSSFSPLRGFVLVAAVTAGLLSACKDDSGGAPKAESQPAAQAAPAAAPAQPAAPAAAATTATAPGKMDFSIPIEVMSTPDADFSSHTGKPLLLFYFSATCPHCQAAFPQVQAFADEVRARGVQTLAIANKNSSPDEIREFMTKYQAKIPVFWDSERRFGQAYDVKLLPTFYAVTKEGDVFRTDSFSGKGSLDSLLAKAKI